jgi:DNA-directed RNA polymerase specialized sigma24 family protein
MYAVSTSSEAVADSSASETHLDIEALFRAHYGRVARIIARVVGDRARSEDLAVEVF